MSTNYSNPWRERDERKRRAEVVVNYFAGKYPARTAEAVRKTVQYPPRNMKNLFMLQQDAEAKLPTISVVQEESVQAAFNHGNGKTAILNFASYKNPGGKFLEGSIAQEESLCHASNLYNILSNDRFITTFYEKNRHFLNNGLYHDNLLYTPDVIFIYEKHTKLFDVITCAAPNKGAAQKYNQITDQECDDAMRSRIRSVLLAAIDQKVDTLILGAFGCGVFKNDPKTVAEIFKEELIGFPAEVVFAVPGEKFSTFSAVFCIMNK